MVAVAWFDISDISTLISLLLNMMLKVSLFSTISSLVMVMLTHLMVVKAISPGTYITGSLDRAK
jgi:hypothetical protein